MVDIQGRELGLGSADLSEALDMEDHMLEELEPESVASQWHSASIVMAVGCLVGVRTLTCLSAILVMDAMREAERRRLASAASSCFSSSSPS